MRLCSVAAAALISGATAAPLETRTFLEIDGLAATGVLNLGFSVALHGYPSKSSCTLENVAVRKEW